MFAVGVLNYLVELIREWNLLKEIYWHEWLMTFVLYLKKIVFVEH